jgi:hypothetical protein
LTEAKLIAMEFEDRRVAEWGSPNHFDFDTDSEAEIIEPPRDGVFARDAENAHGIAAGDPVESVVLGHGGRVISRESDEIGGRG